MRVFVPFVFLLLATIVVTGTQGDAFCDTVMQNLGPCVLYVGLGGEDYRQNCCNSLKDLNGTDYNPTDHKSTCYCVKLFMRAVVETYLPIYATLPDVCKVDLPYKLDPSPECDSVQ